MQVRVLFFGILKDLAGQASDTLTLPDDSTLAAVRLHYEQSIPQELMASLAMSVNREYATLDAKLNQGDEIALLPPVSGGSGQSQAEGNGGPRRHVAIVTGVINTADLLKSIKQPEDGATVAFEGVVRNHTRGRHTLYLDYEAYEEMAVKQMEELAQRALTDFHVRDVAIVHRLGRLEIGETSVLILVASAHRAAAFDACRWLIDTLKRTVPIWKKEYFEDGAVWADGEPFPDRTPGARGTHSAERASK